MDEAQSSPMSDRYVLKMNLNCCQHCPKKVCKLLSGVHGVYSVSVDAENGLATVEGKVDPRKLVKEVKSIHKIAEIISSTQQSNAQAAQCTTGESQVNSPNCNPAPAHHPVAPHTYYSNDYPPPTYAQPTVMPPHSPNYYEPMLPFSPPPPPAYPVHASNYISDENAAGCTIA
ncbi:heavy metal-associated isoprenylated plant protein 42-like [Malania oleifera]|uniref:heavy metal-associated isoprenylated plant protein 42-like n=1 Tax=Malania oleifera TaxID=397392 RepID=UPI0025AE328D|nr:heavy metal-associated isoprenylated plant protein 42-like [Malania oleifera]